MLEIRKSSNSEKVRNLKIRKSEKVRGKKVGCWKNQDLRKGDLKKIN